MKVVNIVLSIMILVLALVSTVFSFFLFEKRTGMVDGWNMMASAISESSGAMGSRISAADLAHEKYNKNDMADKMRRFGSQSKKVVGQRDELGGAMQNIAKSLNIKDATTSENPTAEQIAAADESSPVSAKKIADEVGKAVRQRDEAKKRAEKAALNLSEIGKIVGTSSRNPETITKAVRVCKRKCDSATEELKQAKRNLIRVQDEKNSAEQQRDDYKSRLYSANRENDTLKKELTKVKRDFKLLTKTEYGEIPMWGEGSDEARSQVVGKVIKIDRENGYVVIDLNNKVRVTQKVGQREYKVDPKLVNGLEMIVCRGDLTGSRKVKFIARIKIDSIDDNCMVANIPAQAGHDIKVGDNVINNTFYEKTLKGESK